MSKPQIRRATRDDLQQLISLLADDPIGKERETLGAAPAQPYVDAFAAIDADPNQFLAVADDAGAIVGMLQLTFIPGIARKGAMRGQIEGVRVSSTRRGDGLGARMIEWAVDKCAERGCALVQLTSDKRREDAHRFYERLGFSATHEGYKRTL